MDPLCKGVIDAARSMLVDVEAMETGQPEAYGYFTDFELQPDGESVSAKWPNLAITSAALRAALDKYAAGDENEATDNRRDRISELLENLTAEVAAETMKVAFDGNGVLALMKSMTPAFDALSKHVLAESNKVVERLLPLVGSAPAQGTGTAEREELVGLLMELTGKACGAQAVRLGYTIQDAMTAKGIMQAIALGKECESIVNDVADRILHLFAGGQGPAPKQEGA